MQWKPIPQENTQTAEQFAQRDCAIIILGGFQDPIGSSSEEPGLTPELTCFEWEDGQGPPVVTSRPGYPITMWFCTHSAGKKGCG